MPPLLSQLMETIRMSTREPPPPPLGLTTTLPCWRKPSPEFPARTTPSTPRFPSLDFLVTDRLTEVTTPTPRPSVKSSTSALLTEPEVPVQLPLPQRNCLQ